MAPGAIPIVVVDPRPPVRAGLAAIFARGDDLAVVGEFPDAESFLAAGAIDARAAVISVRLPGRDGVALAREMAERYPSVACILMTEGSLPRYTRAAISAGARGCISTSQSEEEIVRAVRDAARGGTSFADVLDDDDGDVEPISSREREVLLLAAKGMLHKEIATRLYISQRTVQTHLASVYDKLGARNKTEALLAALQRGVVVIEELFGGA